MPISPIRSRRRAGHRLRWLPAAGVLAAMVVWSAGVIATPAYGDSHTVDVTAAPYHAKGDGVTNDRAAIQAAIDDAGAAGGGTVTLPAGHTFLSGNLKMRSKVTLRIDGTLLQSQDPDHYTEHLILGHRIPGEFRSFVTWYHNYPLVYAGHKKDVTVTGGGTIQMTQVWRADGSFDHGRTIHVLPVAFYEVEGFELSGLQILGANTYNGVVYWSRDGVVDGLRIRPNPLERINTDGFQIKNSQRVRFTGNTLTDIHDDGIVVGATYDDPRDGTWWQSKRAATTSDIEIAGNTLEGHSAGVVFIPWATKAPDPGTVETSNIRIHHNTFHTGRDGVGVRVNNVYDSSPAGPDAVTPMRDIRIWDNDVVYTGYHDALGESWMALHRARITDLYQQDGALSSRDFVNGDFDSGGMAFWSHSNDAGSADTDVSPLRDRQARIAAAAVAGQWGRYGYAQGAGSSLYQGLGLSDQVPYTVTADVVTSTTGAELFVHNTCTDRTVATLPVTATEPRRVNLGFRAEGTCGIYQVGVRVADGWALLDKAVIAPDAGLVDETAGQYEGKWSFDNDPTSYGHGVAQTMRSRATASFTFHGTRAWLFSHQRPDGGLAEIYLDGVYQTTVDLYHRIWTDKVAFDTGVLRAGIHEITLVGTGERNPDSAGTRLSVDALLVEDHIPPPATLRLQQGATFHAGEPTEVTGILKVTNPEADLADVRHQLDVPGGWSVQAVSTTDTRAKWLVTPPADASTEYVEGVSLVASTEFTWRDEQWTTADNADGYLFPDSVPLPDRVVDNDDPAPEYAGRWRTYPAADDIGGRHASGSGEGASVSVTFTGTRAQFVGRPSPFNAHAAFYVDGVHQATVDFYRETAQYQQIMFDTGALAPGEHTLTVVNTGEAHPDARNDTITFDGLYLWK